MAAEYTVVHSDGGTEVFEPQVGSRGYSPVEWGTTAMGHNLDGISSAPLAIDYDRKPGDPSGKKSLIG